MFFTTIQDMKKNMFGLTASFFASRTWSTFFHEVGKLSVSSAEIKAAPSIWSFSKRPLKPISSIWPALRDSSVGEEFIVESRSSGLRRDSYFLRSIATRPWAPWWFDWKLKIEKLRLYYIYIYIPHKFRIEIYFWSLNVYILNEYRSLSKIYKSFWHYLVVF